MTTPSKTRRPRGQSPDACLDADIGKQDRAPEKGTLYLVATPIGNLGDLSQRAIAILSQVDLVAAEDTRVTRGLLSHLKLSKPLVACHQHNERESASGLMGKLAQGRSIALVSDAGTPGVSDPGHAVVQAAIEAGYPVVAIPGASAVLTALVASGLPPQPFYFGGFLPRAGKERRSALEAAKALPATLVFFESPHRVLETLADLAGALGDRPACLCREMTKLHEEVLRGTLASLAARAFEHRGEFTLVVGPPLPQAAPDPAESGPEDVASLIERAMAGGKSRNQAVAEAARLTGLPRDEVYRQAHGLKP